MEEEERGVLSECCSSSSASSGAKELAVAAAAAGDADCAAAAAASCYCYCCSVHGERDLGAGCRCSGDRETVVGYYWRALRVAFFCALVGCSASFEAYPRAIRRCNESVKKGDRARAQTRIDVGV